LKRTNVAQRLKHLAPCLVFGTGSLAVLSPVFALGLDAWMPLQAGTLTRTFQLTLASLGNTFFLVVGTLAIAVTLGFPLSLMLYRGSIWGGKAARFLLLFALLLPMELHAMAWLSAAGMGTPGGLRQGSGMLEVALGALTQLLGLELSQARLSWGARLGAAVWVHGLIAAGWFAVILGVALRLVDRELEEEASLLASRWQLLWYIVLPCSWWGLGAALALAAILTVGEIAVVDLLQFPTLADVVYISFQLDADPEQAALIALPTVVLLMASTGLAWPRLLRRLETLRRNQRAVPSLVGRRWATRMVGTAFTWGMVCLLLGFTVRTLLARAALAAGEADPSASLLESSKNASPSSWDATAGAASGTKEVLARLAAAFWEKRGVIYRELAVSFGCSLAGSAAALLVAGGLAWWARRGRWWWAACAGVVVLLGSLPSSVIGMAVARTSMWASPSLYDSYGPLVWALALRVLPIQLVILFGSLSREVQLLWEAALLDGAGLCARWRHVLLPSLAGPALLALLLGLVIGMADVGAAVITAPPGVPPLTVAIFGLLHYGLDDYVAALALWLLLAVGAVVMAVSWFLRR
jgi:iron(III) transport system permease protein